MILTVFPDYFWLNLYFLSFQSSENAANSPMNQVMHFRILFKSWGIMQLICLNTILIILAPLRIILSCWIDFKFLFKITSPTSLSDFPIIHCYRFAVLLWIKLNKLNFIRISWKLMHYMNCQHKNVYHHPGRYGLWHFRCAVANELKMI